jgi:predicted RNA-binding protein YlqC (UPF0109 family)
MPKQLIEYIARSLADMPEQVSVTEGEEDGRGVLELRCAPADIGKIIGRNGRMAKAIRALLAATVHDGPAYSLEIMD